MGSPVKFFMPTGFKKNLIILTNMSLSILVLHLSHSIRGHKRKFPAVMVLALEWKILCNDNCVFIQVNWRRGEVRVTSVLPCTRAVLSQTNAKHRTPRVCVLLPLVKSAKRGTSLNEELSAKSREEILVPEHNSMPLTFLLPIIRFLIEYGTGTCPLYINNTVILLVLLWECFCAY